MRVQIISGPPGAGKSTISKLYVQGKPNTARIETDDLRHMIISSHKAPWEGEEGMRQLLLGVNNACLLAKEFIKAGFDVVIVDFVTDKTAPIYRENLKQYSPYLVQLLPDSKVAEERFNSRGETLTDEEFKMLYDIQIKFKNCDLQIDNSLLSPQQVVDRLMKL